MTTPLPLAKKLRLIAFGFIGLLVAVAHILHGEYVVHHHITQPGVLTVLLFFADLPAVLYLVFLETKPSPMQLLTMQCVVSLLNAALYAAIGSYLVKRLGNTE